MKSVFVPQLAQVVRDLGFAGGARQGGELVILKPYNSLLPNVPLPKPIESFDFAGLQNDSALGSGARMALFADRAAAPPSTSGLPWSFIYPGRYDGATPNDTVTGLPSPHHQGTQRGDWSNSVGADTTMNANRDPFDSVPFTTLPNPRPTLGSIPGPADADSASPEASYFQTFKTQLLNLDQPGWNGSMQESPRIRTSFRLAHSRNSDILQVPFFGAYRVQLPAGGGDLELNSISMDAAFCEDTDTNDDEGGLAAVQPPLLHTYEQLGRFCPLNYGFNVPQPARRRLATTLIPRSVSEPATSTRAWIPAGSRTRSGVTAGRRACSISSLCRIRRATICQTCCQPATPLWETPRSPSSSSRTRTARRRPVIRTPVAGRSPQNTPRRCTA